MTARKTTRAEREEQRRAQWLLVERPARLQEVLAVYESMDEKRRATFRVVTRPNGRNRKAVWLWGDDAYQWLLAELALYAYDTSA